jgi:hypothetical protein
MKIGSKRFTQDSNCISQSPSTPIRSSPLLRGWAASCGNAVLFKV